MRIDRKTTRAIALFASIIALLALAQGSASAAPENVRHDDGLYIVSHYDVARDPAADLAAAITRAQASGKRVLIEVGGDWCPWCMLLDDYIEHHSDVREAMAASFVIVKVSVGPTRDNAAFLSAYPTIEGYPAMLVLDGSGHFVQVADVTALQDDAGFSLDRMVAFAQHWAPRTEPVGS